MKIPRRSLSCTIIVALSALSAAATPARAQSSIASTQQILAHGTEDDYWIARVGPGEDPNQIVTVIQHRAAAAANWSVVGRINGRAVSLANRAGDLVVLLENGQWMFTWPGGGAAGMPLANGARMLALAGDRGSLWALGAGEIDPIESPTTRPLAAPRSENAAPHTIGATTRSAASAPARARGLAIFAWENQRWSPRAMLPDELVAATQADVAFALVSSRPVVAARDRGSRLHVIRLEPDGRWMEEGIVGREARFALLNSARPALWLQSGGLAGSIVPLDALESPPTVLAAPDRLEARDVKTVTAATGRLRLVFMNQRKLFEQSYTVAGEKRDLTELPAAQNTSGEGFPEWIGLSLLVILTLLVFGPSRRASQSGQDARGTGDDPNHRGASGEDVIGRRIIIAPLKVRLQAGSIDALPLLAVLFYVAMQRRVAPPEETAQLIQTWSRLTALALGIYFLHTLAGELLSSRTLGKRLFGLRVLMADGSPPRAVAIVVRNIIRVLEALLPISLMVLIFTPLRQRIGDIAAGTIVVLDERNAKEPREP